MGWVLSFVNALPGGDLVNAKGSPHGGPALDPRVGLRPGVVGDPMHVEKQHAREPGGLRGVCASRPVREGESHKPDMHAAEESDCTIVPVKPPNKGVFASAEVVEGRVRTKENAVGSRRSPTQSGERLSQGLDSVGRVVRGRESPAPLCRIIRGRSRMR